MNVVMFEKSQVNHIQPNKRAAEIAARKAVTLRIGKVRDDIKILRDETDASAENRRGQEARGHVCPFRGLGKARRHW